MNWYGNVLNRLRGLLHSMLFDMDWGKYNYVVETPKHVTVYWARETGRENVNYWVYLGKRMTASENWWRNVSTDSSVHKDELPIGGYRVYDPTKKKAIAYTKNISVEDYVTFYVRPILYPCQMESADSLLVRRNNMFADLGATVIRYDEDGGKLYKGPSVNSSQYTAISTMFNQDHLRIKRSKGGR